MQKLFYKLLNDCENDFETFIGTKLQVINSRLILDRSDDTYLVREVHKKSGYFTYKHTSSVNREATLSSVRRDSNLSLSPHSLPTRRAPDETRCFLQTPCLPPIQTQQTHKLPSSHKPVGLERKRGSI